MLAESRTWSTTNKFRLGINWSKGKTEGILVLRGSKAVEVRESFRHNGKLCVWVSGANQWLHIVDSYKHLGCVVSARRTNIPYAQLRASTAMSAYSPSSRRIFAAAGIGLWLKMIFLHSLVLSSLLVQLPRSCDGQPYAVLIAWRLHARSPQNCRSLEIQKREQHLRLSSQRDSFAAIA